MKPFQGRGDEFNQAIAESTQGLQVVTAKKILPGLEGLPARLEAGGAVLEVGCGTGNLLLQLAKAFPEGARDGRGHRGGQPGGRAREDRRRRACRTASRRDREPSRPLCSRAASTRW